MASKLASARHILQHTRFWRLALVCSSGKEFRGRVLGQRGGDFSGHLDRSRLERLCPDCGFPPRDDGLCEVRQDSTRATERVGCRVDGLVVDCDRGGRDGFRDFVRPERGDEGRGLVGEAEGVGEQSCGQFGVPGWVFVSWKVEKRD